MLQHKKAHPLSLTIILALGIQTVVSAEESEETNASSVEKITVTGSYLEGYNAHSASGASRMELAIKDIPQSVSVITSAQLQDFQLTDVNLALDTATGVNVERIETDRTYYTARGFDITNFQIDGIGLPLTSGNNHAGDDTAVYDRIEVIRGANGLMTGVGNPSATVNYIRKRPGQDNELQVRGTLGSYDLYRLEADGTYQISDSVSARGVLVQQDQNSYLDRYGRESQLAYVFVNADLSENTQISFSHSYNNSDATGNLWGALPLYYTDGSATDYDRGTSTSANWSNWQVVTNNSVFELNHALSSDWGLRATYSRKTTDEDSELFYVFGTPDRETELGLTGYASEYILDDEHDLFDLYLDGEFALFGRDHQLVLGVNYSSLSYTDRSLYDFTTGNGFPAIPNLNTWDGNAVFPTLIDGENGSKVDQSQKAVYFTTRLNLFEGFHVMLGGRHNDWEAEGESYGVDRDVSDSDFIPYAGVVYDITDDLNVYASYTETFQAQNELDINNQQLDPVVGESQEVGFKMSLFDDGAIANLTYFDVQQTNLAIVDPSTVNLPPELVRYVGSEGIGSHGFEFDIAGEVLTGLNLSLGITDFSVSGEQTVADFTPSTMVKAAALYEPSELNGLSLGLNVRWQSSISRLQGTVADGFSNAGADIVTEQDAYAIADLLVKYQVNDAVSLNFNVFNISDEKYLTSLYWAQSYYGSPRSFSASVSWLF
ncbi:TonB-dependent siderophore receptor [Alteromonas sp. W364]|uniref:TonB-dependent siderophore receptor n=1 Tax=Alteromonas sp. W364 TaxID=3075610 RepID=UPI0028848216|nr:TonB-dependent siderophore receptor [Alteromonas sp. W364]MDT0629275.1 TonB-dependent siderophore receptor [Alteromonas sp. W364]